MSSSKSSTSSLVDAILAPTAIAALLAYHAFLCYKLRTSPLKTRMGINRQARRLWVFEMLTDNHKKNVLAVQTIRNSLMESTLLATTTVLLIAALAAYFTFANNFKHLLGGGVGGAMPSSLDSMSTAIKSFSVLACLMLSFLCHTQSIRYYNHVNYMINIPLTQSISSEYIAELLQRASVLYTLGSRTFYIAFPLLLWVFGTVPMFLCAIILLHALYSSDFPRCANHSSDSTMLDDSQQTQIELKF